MLDSPFRYFIWQKDWAMRKLIAVTILAGALAVASYAAISANDSQRPPDVEAKNWIALGPNWGFVVDSVSTSAQPIGQPAVESVSTGPRATGQPVAVPLNPTALYAPPDARLVPPTLNGFFVVKRDGAWARIAALPLP
jgi:hypothetical protein